MLWISNQVYLNQAYLRGGIEKCCRKKIEQEIVLKRNYSKILCKSIMTQVCIDEQQNVKRWQNFTKRSHIFPEPEKHTVSIFNRVLLSESERIAALLRKRKYHLTTTSAWLQKLVIQGISVFPGWEGRGGEGREWWENCSPHWLQPVLTLKDQKSLYKVHHDPSDSWLKKWKNSKSLFWK